MISVDALLEFAVLEASAYEQRQLPPLNDLNQLYPASDFLKQKIHKIDSDEKRRQKLFMLKKAGKRITASIACLLAVFTCIFAPVEAVQDAVISTVIEWRDKFNQAVTFLLYLRIQYVFLYFSWRLYNEKVYLYCAYRRPRTILHERFCR